jgi:hypothetical protein
MPWRLKKGPDAYRSRGAAQTGGFRVQPSRLQPRSETAQQYSCLNRRAAVASRTPRIGEAKPWDYGDASCPISSAGRRVRSAARRRILAVGRREPGAISQSSIERIA